MHTVTNLRRLERSLRISNGSRPKMWIKGVEEVEQERIDKIRPGRIVRLHPTKGWRNERDSFDDAD